MQMGLAVVMFVVGLVLIVKGGDAFVDAASWMAEVSGIPPFIVGATVVSLATTLPEMLVSVFAALRGSVDMACGNAVGSVIANTGLILGIAVVALPNVVKRSEYLGKSLLLLASCACLVLFSRSGSLSFVGVWVLLAVLVVFILENVRSAKRGAIPDDGQRPPHDRQTVLRNLLLFAFGAAGIVIGAQLLVDSATTLATLLGVPEAVIAVTIVAVGTSLPELVTTITAIIKRQSSLSAGNIIGANIIDTTLILPVCSLLSGQRLPLGPQALQLDLPFCLFIVALALLPMLFAQRFARWQGVTLLGAYGVYLAMVVL